MSTLNEFMKLAYEAGVGQAIKEAGIGDWWEENVTDNLVDSIGYLDNLAGNRLATGVRGDVSSGHGKFEDYQRQQHMNMLEGARSTAKRWKKNEENQYRFADREDELRAERTAFMGPMWRYNNHSSRADRLIDEAQFPYGDLQRAAIEQARAQSALSRADSMENEADLANENMGKAMQAAEQDTANYYRLRASLGRGRRGVAGMPSRTVDRFSMTNNPGEFYGFGNSDAPQKTRERYPNRRYIDRY